MFKFKKIASVLASSAMVLSTVGLAAAANYPAPFNSGAAAIVYGSNAQNTDLVGAINIQSSLSGSAVASNLGGTSDTVTGEAYPLFTSSSPLQLNASLNSIRGSVTESNFPTILADSTFTATSATTDDSTIESTFKIDVGSNPRVIFDKEPTSSDDPAVGILIGANAASYLYNATVTFNKGVNFTDTDSSGEDIDLFGQKFTIASATDATSLVLFKSADSVFLDSSNNPSQEIVIDGNTYTIDLVTAESTSATIKLTDSSGNTAQDEISEGSSRKLLGVEVAVDTASQNNLVYSATVIVGASRIKLTDGSEVELGTEEDPIEGTQVDFTGNSGTPADLTGITIQVYAEDGSSDFITPEMEFIDPVFGTFKLDFVGLEGDSDRETIDVKSAGNDKMTISLTNWQGKELSNFEWLNNESTSILADSGEWRIYIREHSKINETSFGVVGNEDDGYLVRLKTLTNSSSTTASDDKIVFENVFDTTQTWEATITAEGTGTIDIGGKQYGVSYWDDRDGDNDEYVQLNYPDSTGNDIVVYPSIETSKGAKLIFYEPLNINLADADLTGTAKNISNIKIPDGDGYTSIVSTIAANDELNFTLTVGSGTATLVNTTAAAGAASASGAIGPFTFNMTSTGTANTAKLYVVDPSGGNVATPAILVIEEQDEGNSYNGIIVRTAGAGTSDNGVGVSDVDFSWNVDAAMDGSAYGTSGLQLESNEDLYQMMDIWGTKVTVDQSTSDQYTASISYPADQTTASVYIAESSASISGGTGTGSGNANVVALADTEIAQASGKNIVVVGGSCVNSVAAILLGLSGQVCGADFTAATNVGSGQFLIKSFDSPTGTGKVATLVAGFNAGDTTNGVTYLTTKTPSTAVNDAYIGTSGTSAEMVVASA